MAYTEGMLKQDPVTKAVAIKTASGFTMPWSVMTTSQGGHHASDEDVANWIDIPGTPVPDPEPEE